MFTRIANVGQQGWLRTFVMGVAAGLTAQAIAGGWCWLRRPALGGAVTPEPTSSQPTA
jgi:hypothetical protein